MDTRLFNATSCCKVSCSPSPRRRVCFFFAENSLTMLSKIFKISNVVCPPTFKQTNTFAQMIYFFLSVGPLNFARGPTRLCVCFDFVLLQRPPRSLGEGVSHDMSTSFCILTHCDCLFSLDEYLPLCSSLRFFQHQLRHSFLWRFRGTSFILHWLTSMTQLVGTPVRHPPSCFSRNSLRLHQKATIKLLVVEWWVGRAG